MESIYLSIGKFVCCINFGSYNDSTFMPVYFKDKIKNEIISYLSGYIIEKPVEKPDYYIDFVDQNQFFQNDLSKDSKGNFRTPYYKITSAKKVVTYYHISLYQFQFILKTILARKFAGKKWFIFHSSVVNLNGDAFAFTGKSGAGKSTAAKLLSSTGKYNSLADDTSLVMEENNKFYIFQTPFTEKDSSIKKGKEKYLLDKVFFLKKSKYYRVEKINNKTLVLEQIVSGLVAFSKTELNNQTTLALRFINSFDQFYYLYFGLDKDKLSHLMDTIT